MKLLRNQGRQVAGIVKPQNIPYEENSYNRVCWKTEANSPRIICYCCYENHDNILSEHSLTNPDFIARIYETLNADENAFVLNKYYIAAKNLINGTPETQLAQDVT